MKIENFTHHKTMRDKYVAHYEWLETGFRRCDQRQKSEYVDAICHFVGIIESIGWVHLSNKLKKRACAMLDEHNSMVLQQGV